MERIYCSNENALLIGSFNALENTEAISSAKDEKTFHSKGNSKLR